MGEMHTLLLGVIAGATILLGMPLGRLRTPAIGLRLFLNATAIGILTFLLWDVLTHAWQPIDNALSALHDGAGGLAPVLGYGTLFVVGLGAGLMGLAGYERWLDLRQRAEPSSTGPGAMAAGELSRRRGSSWTGARRLALLIAVGIGLHNFGEGLAIGGSAARGESALATRLVVGFALHNATEGFGIVAPMAAEAERPGWPLLLGLGLIGGGPTVLGTVLGHQFSSDAVSILFLTLAGGSILYVVIQLVGIALRSPLRTRLYWGVLVGLLAGFATDMVVTAAGA
jgi:ZIP family zinc transporter